MVQNWSFSPTHCFLRSPWDLPTILARGPRPKRPKTPFFRPRSYSKGPNHALEKVLTNETPGIKKENKNRKNGKKRENNGEQNKGKKGVEKGRGKREEGGKKGGTKGGKKGVKKTR